MAISREIAQQNLDAWLAASLAVAGGQSYRIGERELTRADATEVRRMIDYWDLQLTRAKNGGQRLKIYAGVPR